MVTKSNHINAICTAIQDIALAGLTRDKTRTDQDAYDGRYQERRDRGACPFGV